VFVNKVMKTPLWNRRILNEPSKGHCAMQFVESVHLVCHILLLEQYFLFWSCILFRVFLLQIFKIIMKRTVSFLIFVADHRKASIYHNAIQIGAVSLQSSNPALHVLENWEHRGSNRSITETAGHLAVLQRAETAYMPLLLPSLTRNYYFAVCSYGSVFSSYKVAYYADCLRHCPV
jgi:hypothetical protein